MKRRLLAALASLASPSSANACAACVAAADRNRTAFLITTILLSLLPLALIACGLWWIAHHARGRLAGEFEEREPIAGATEEVLMTDDAAAARAGNAKGSLLAAGGAGRKG